LNEKDLDPTIVPELKLEHAVTAIRIGVTSANGPIVFSATLYTMLTTHNQHKYVEIGAIDTV